MRPTEMTDSYIGCEYWPTPVTNAVAEEFDFAVVAANPQTVEATVTVFRGASTVAEVVVAPESTETIRLPWIGRSEGCQHAPARRPGGHRPRCRPSFVKAPTGWFQRYL